MAASLGEGKFWIQTLIWLATTIGHQLPKRHHTWIPFKRRESKFNIPKRGDLSLTWNCISLIIRRSLVSLILVGGLNPLEGIQSAYYKPYQQEFGVMGIHSTERLELVKWESKWKYNKRYSYWDRVDLPCKSNRFSLCPVIQ